MNPAVILLRGAVTTYQWTLRPFIGCNCRFHPSCSDYAKEALAVHGALRGSLMAGARILRCNPWHPGGYDPVPAPVAGLEQTPTGCNLPAGKVCSRNMMSRAASPRSGAARMRSARSKAALAATKG